MAGSAVTTMNDTALLDMMQTNRLGRLTVAHERYPRGGTLAFEPIVGELGHELMAAAVARAMSRNYGQTLVWTRPGREILYADFAKVAAHNIKCEGMMMSGYTNTDGGKRYTSTSDLLPQLPPDAVVRRMSEYSTGLRPEFRRYGTPSAAFAGVTVFHARNRAHVTMRNWPVKNWSALAEKLRKAGLADRVVCIGTPEAAAKVPGCEDARSFDLGAQMNIMASARWAIGPSSGPMHIAEHCGCPVVVWCGGAAHERAETQRRYRSTWNPFRVPCHAEQYASWRPAVGAVFNWCMAFMSELGR